MKKDKTLLLIMILLTSMAIGSCTNRGTNTPIYTQSSTTNTGQPLPGDTLISTTRGEALFQQHCMACHGRLGDARNNKAADLQLTRLDSIGIATTILNGRGTMPPFKDALPDSDIASIIVYVRSLRQYNN